MSSITHALIKPIISVVIVAQAVVNTGYLRNDYQRSSISTASLHPGAGLMWKMMALRSQHLVCT